MSHVAHSPQNRHFEPISGHFTPIRPQIIVASGMGYPILGTRETWVVPTVPLATVLPSHAPRSTPDQRGEVVHRTSPPGYCLPPTGQLPKTERARSRRAGRLFQYVTEPGDFADKIINHGQRPWY